MRDELPDCERELGTFDVAEDGGVKVWIGEERILVVVLVAPGQVACTKAQEAIRLGYRCEMAGCVRQELEPMVEDVRISSQDDTVGEVRKGTDKRVRELRAPGMPDVEDFLGLLDVGEFSVSRGCRQGCKEGDLDGRLDFGLWVCEG